MFGLGAFGTGEALFVQARLGSGPWTVLAQGLSLRAGINIGLATLVVSAGVLAPWIALRQQPGLGTIVSMVIMSTALGVGALLIPPQTLLPLQLAMTLAGIGLIGLGSALYLTCGLGAGPRDGLMTGIHERYGWPVARVRLTMEIAALAIGWLLGGTVGVGSALFALLVGRSMAIFLGLMAPRA